MKNINYVVLDCETGGFTATKNPITQIAAIAVDHSRFAELRQYQTFVKPYNNLVIEDQALNATMVSMRDIQSGIDHRILVKNLIEFFKAINPTGKKQTRPIIVGHNIKFDRGFLEYLFELNGKNLYDYVQETMIDTIHLAKMAWDHEMKNDEANNSYKLSSCCSRAGILLNDAHGAMNDTIATKELWLFFARRLRNSGGSGEKSGEVQEEGKSRKFFQM
jgi:DNA polymerase III alpha subunit (gram-positive type)